MPQAKEANLTAHLEHVRGAFSGSVPADFGGICNIDFEGWNTNVWEWIWCDVGGTGNATHHAEYAAGYQTYSVLLVQRDHPTWTLAQCTAEAKRQYEAAAEEWLVATLEVVKELFPKCHWGYFAGPSQCAPYWPCARGSDGEWRCSFDHPTEGARLRALAAKQLPVQMASTVLNPMLYPGYFPYCTPWTEWQFEGCTPALPNCTDELHTKYGAENVPVWVSRNQTAACGCYGIPNETVTMRYSDCEMSVNVTQRSIETDRAWIRAVVGQVSTVA